MPHPKVTFGLASRIVLLSVLVVTLVVGGLLVFLSLDGQLPPSRRWQLVAAAAGAIGLLVPLLYCVLYFTVLRPIRSLTGLSRRLAEGDVPLPPADRRRDEVGELARAFRDMVEAMRERERRQAALVGVGQEVSAVQESDAIFRLLVERGPGLFECDHLSVALLDRQTATWSVACASEGWGQLIGRSYNLDNGLPGWAMRTGNPALVHDLSQDSRADTPVEQEWTAQGCGPALVVPLREGGTVVGTLNVVGSIGRAYDQDDLARLAVLGGQVDAALHSAGALGRERRRSEQLRVLAEVNREITSIIDVDTLLRRVAEIIRETFGYHRVNVGLVEGEELIFYSRVGDPGEVLQPVRLKVGEGGITSWVTRTGQPLLVNDVTVEPLYVLPPPPETVHTLSELAVPIALAGDVLGVLDVQSTLRGAFGDEDLEALEILAGHLAVALQEARLLERERRRADQLRALGEVSRQMASILHPDTLVQRVGQLLREAFGYYRVNVGLIEGQDLLFQARIGERGETLPPSRVTVGGEGVAAWVAESGEPLVIRDLTQEPRHTPPSPSEETRALSELAVPVSVGGKVIGVLDVQSTGRGAFGDEDLGLLQTLASHLAVALENARLYAEAQQRLQEQSALLATNASVSSTLQLGEVVRRVARAMVEATNTTACAISTWEQEAGTVTVLAEHTHREVESDGWGEELGVVYRLEDYPATAEVLNSGKPLVINRSDPESDARERAVLQRFEVESLLILPLRARDRVVGLVELYDEKQERSYSDQEIAFCQALANHAGLAVENARLYENVRKERDAVELLYQVAHEFSTALDLEVVLPRVLALAVEQAGAFRGSIIELDPTGHPRHHTLFRGDLSPSAIRRLIQDVLERGLAGWVVRNLQAVIVEDTTADPRWLETADSLKGVRSALAVPLMRGDALVGVLTLVHREKGYFNENHLQLMGSVANQAAVAIDNARLFLDTQRRVAQLNTLLEVAQSLTSDRPIRELLELITLSAHGVLDASNTVLYLLSEAGDTLVPRAALGVDSVALREAAISVGEGVTGLVVQEGRPRMVDEAHLSALARQPLLERSDEGESLISVPLMHGAAAIGALTIGRYGTGVHFDPADLEIAELLASQAVVAVNNARLYEQVRRRADELASLNRIARTVGSTLDLDQVLREIIGELNQSVRVEAGSVLLLDEARQDLYFVTTLEGGLERFLDVRLPIGVGIVGCVAKTGEPALVNDVASDPRFYDKVSSDVGFVTRSILCVPLISRDRIIGVIELLNKVEGDFDQQDLERLQSISATVAVAIENAGLYEQTEEERSRLDAILTSTADVVIATDAQRRLLLINPAAAQAFHLDPEEHVGKPLGEALAHGGLRGLFERAEGRSRPFTDELTLEEGTTYNVDVSPVRGAGGTILGHVAVMQDITTLKELDQMKSDFVATVSHDLKNPLTSVRGFADLIRITGELNPEQEQFIGRIKDATEGMAALIGDLLDIGKIEAGIEMKQVPCDVGDLAAEVVSELEIRSQMKSLTVTLEKPDGVPLVIGDPDRLKQVLMNLVGNAIKYTDSGGDVRVWFSTDDGQLVTSVQDSGIGIAPRDQKQLFQKFYRVQSEETAEIEGTGLGLAIARSIVERHRGRIWVESDLGKGSTFSFSLPLASPGEEAAE